jgi:predicted DNA-binding WGR domain protein
MKLIRQTKLHFKEGNSDKVYEIDLCEINAQFVVNFRYGRKGAELKEGSKTTSPVSQAEAEKVFQKLVDEKTKKGYHVVGSQAETVDKPKVAVVLNNDLSARNERILSQLQDKQAKSNPKIERIIWRAGELKITEAASFIVKLIGTAKELRDYCCIWAIGNCGDANLIDEVKKYLTHTSEAVQRIAFEACLKLSDTPQIFISQKLDNLPNKFHRILQTGTNDKLLAALREEKENLKRGSFTILSDIYVVADEKVRPAILEIINEIPLKPKFFKPLRYIFKIAEYRQDAEIFGTIAKRFETSGAGFSISSWSGKNWSRYEYIGDKWTETKKSDLAKDDSPLAFSNRTKDYFIRRTWRTLRKLGEDGFSGEYVKMAVGSLLCYSDSDAQPVRTSTRYNYIDENGNYNWRNPKTITTQYGEFAPYLLFNHILYGNSKRFELKTNNHAFQQVKDIGKAVPKHREESFPQLWNENPVGLLHLISESNCLPVHQFAVKVLQDCTDFVEKLDIEAVLMFLSRPYDITAEFGFELAKNIYETDKSNVRLILAVATCKNETARKEAFGWINSKRELFANDSEMMFKLLTSDYADTREFASNLLQSTNYSDSEAQLFIGKFLSQMLAFGENDGEKAKILGGAIFKTFSKQLRSINLDVVNDLLNHKLVEVQTLGGNILLNHETPAENLSSDLINSLIDSPYAEIRAIGIKLFGQLPDENLVKRDEVFYAFISHELEDVYFSARPIIRRLSEQNQAFTDILTRRLVIGLTQKETIEGLHSRHLQVLKEDLPNWTSFVDEELTRILLKSPIPQACEAGGIVLQNNVDKWFAEFSTAELVEFSNNEILAVREASWQIAEKDKLRFTENQTEVQFLVKALDSKWEDSRNFWFMFFDKHLTDKELTPEIIVSICDSNRNDVQKFGRETIQKYFKSEHGVEYMLKLSEHPTQNMSLFVTNYLENYATDSSENLAQLSPYFIRTLCAVNRSRVAKNRILSFLENEALKSEKSAQIVSEILARQSATVAIGDKAKTIETMLKIHRAFPEIILPIKVKQTEVRANAV